MTKFSIITICLNMEDEIANTISSVLNQTYTDFEYIIKDGVSKDRTVRIAESFAPAFAEKGIPFHIISQADQGIYDAMNQAVQKVRGEWVIFMNAGDRFAKNNILELVAASPSLEQSDVVYGDRILHNRKLFFYQKAKSLETFQDGLPFGHQSTFTKKELFDGRSYSMKYKIESDHLFYLQLYKEGKQFSYFPEAISIYDTHGLSSNPDLLYREKLQILEEQPVRDEEAIQQLKEKLAKKNREDFFHRHLWRFVPQKLREKRRERMNRKAGWKTEEEFFGEEKQAP